MLDSNIQTMLGAFDFQKLMEMQQEEDPDQYSQLSQERNLQQQVAVDTPTAAPVVNTQASSQEPDMAGIMNLAELALAFL